MLDKYYELLEEINNKVERNNPMNFTEIVYSEYELGGLADGQYRVHYQVWAMEDLSHIKPNNALYVNSSSIYPFKHNGTQYYVVLFYNRNPGVSIHVVLDVDFNIVKEIPAEYYIVNNPEKTIYFYSNQGRLYYIVRDDLIRYWDIENDVQVDVVNKSSTMNYLNSAFGVAYFDKTHTTNNTRNDDWFFKDYVKNERLTFCDESSNLIFLINFNNVNQYNLSNVTRVCCIKVDTNEVFTMAPHSNTWARNSIIYWNDSLATSEYNISNAKIFFYYFSGSSLNYNYRATSCQTGNFTELTSKDDEIFMSMLVNGKIGLFVYNVNGSSSIIQNPVAGSNGASDYNRFVIRGDTIYHAIVFGYDGKYVMCFLEIKKEAGVWTVVANPGIYDIPSFYNNNFIFYEKDEIIHFILIQSGFIPPDVSSFGSVNIISLLLSEPVIVTTQTIPLKSSMENYVNASVYNSNLLVSTKNIFYRFNLKDASLSATYMFPKVEMGNFNLFFNKTSYDNNRIGLFHKTKGVIFMDHLPLYYAIDRAIKFDQYTFVNCSLTDNFLILYRMINKSFISVWKDGKEIDCKYETLV